MTKRIIFSSAIAVLIFASYAAWADDPIVHPFQVKNHKLFEPVESALHRLVAVKATAETNHLCVIGQDLEDDGQQAWVYWQEGRAIILWEPAASGAADLASSRRFLRLGRDVVPANDRRLQAGSSYLVSIDWAKDLIAECLAQGDQYVIRKSSAAESTKAERKKEQ